MKIVVTDTNFADQVVVPSKTMPVVVDFRADWCAPCKLLDPVLEELAGRYEGKIVVGSLDVDANPQTASKYSVMSIPTTIFFQNGQEVKRIVGFAGQEPIAKEINSLLD